MGWLETNTKDLSIYKIKKILLSQQDLQFLTFTCFCHDAAHNICDSFFHTYAKHKYDVKLPNIIPQGHDNNNKERVNEKGKGTLSIPKAFKEISQCLIRRASLVSTNSPPLQERRDFTPSQANKWAVNLPPQQWHKSYSYL